MRYVLLVLCVFSSIAHAAGDFSLRLNEVRVADLCRLVFTDIAKKSYVLDLDLVRSDDVATVDFVGLDDIAVFRQVERLLDVRGYQVVDKAGVLLVTKKRPDSAIDTSVYVYRPVNRSVSYLYDMASGVVDQGGFLNRRQDAFSQPQQSGDQTEKPKAADSGTSAYSLQSKPTQDVIVYRGSQRDIDVLDKLLRQLDVRSPEVVVKAMVYEVRNSNSQQNAVSMTLGLLDSLRGIGFSITSSLVDSANAAKIRVNNFSAVWSALNSDARYKLLTSPTVRIKSGGQAHFMAGSSVPIQTGVTATTTSTTTSYEYKDAGVILDLVPQIRDQTTDLQIHQQISSFTTTTLSSSANPTILKRDVSTEFSVAGDEIVVIGGLDETTDEASRAGVPFLPSFLDGRKTTADKTEILMLFQVERI